MRKLLALLCLLPTLAWATCPLTDAYSTAVCADSPTSYYRMDASSGTTETDVGSAPRNGTYTGGFTLSQTGIIGAGTDKAASFDGVNGAMEDQAGGDPAQFYPQSTNAVGWSVELWGKKSATGYYANVGTSASGGSYGWYMYDNGGAILVAVTQSNCTTAATAPQNGSGASDGAYHHLVMTTLGNGTNFSALKVYLDASLITNITSFTGTSICASSGVRKLALSEYVPTPAYSASTLDEVAFYASALSQARVTAHYTAGSTVAAPAGLNSYSVKRPELPMFRTSDYWQRFVSKGYNTGLFASSVAWPQMVGFFAPFSIVPNGIAR